ncbi:MAG: hypothetical protein V1697_00200 [Candidatus Levyibacteriota bacterium]
MAAKKNNTHFSKKEAIKLGFQTAKKNIIFFIGIFVIVTLVFALTTLIQSSTVFNKDAASFIIGNILVFVVNMVIDMGLIRIAIKFADHEKPVFSDLFYTPSLINYILTSVMSSVIVLIGLVLFIVPGIIFALKIQFSSYLVVDKGLGPVEAIQKSWRMTKGVKWNLFLFALLLMFINLAGLIALVVGLFISVPLTMVANAFVYRKLLSQVK